MMFVTKHTRNCVQSYSTFIERVLFLGCGFYPINRDQLRVGGEREVAGYSERRRYVIRRCISKRVIYIRAKSLDSVKGGRKERGDPNKEDYIYASHLHVEAEVDNLTRAII